MRHDLTLEAADLGRDGALVPGATATYDGTQMHGSPFPIHTKAHRSAVTLTYQFEYRDRRVHVEIVPEVFPLFACPVCKRACALLRLNDMGDFVCELCMPFAVTRGAACTRRQRQPKWQRMQARTLEIRKELRNYVDEPRAIKWTGSRITKARWKALVDELKVLEPKMIAAYMAYAKGIVDTITGIQGPLADQPEKKNPPVAGRGGSAGG